MIDLGRPRRHPTLEIVSAETYEFCVSVRVAFASADDAFTDFDVGRAWVEAARARCAARDPEAFATLGLYVGADRPESLDGSVLSLVHRAPEPRTVPTFLTWLATFPADQLVGLLLDQMGLGPGWPATLAAALAAPQDDECLAPVLKHYDIDQWPTVRAALAEPEEVRRRLVEALHVWYEAVFKAEIPRIMPMVERERAALERLRDAKSARGFIEAAMHGVQWDRTEANRIVFVPSYFARPAVFYHLWGDVLTFCLPVDDTRVYPMTAARDPHQPSPDMLRFFEALGDNTRLRILRLLAAKEMYLTELADSLGLKKPTIKFHMVKLRVAGLVILHDRGRLTYYELRTDGPRRARDLLAGYLGLPRRELAPPVE